MTINPLVMWGLLLLVTVILVGPNNSGGGEPTATVVALDLHQNDQDMQQRQQQTAEISSMDKYVQCENVPGVGGTTTVTPVVLEGKRFYDEATGEYFPVKGTCTGCDCVGCFLACVGVRYDTMKVFSSS